MGKASIIVYVTAAILILLFLSYSPKKHSSHRHRRLKLRSNFTFTTSHHASQQHHEHVAFDPIVAEIERRREEKQWEKQYFEHSHSEFDAHDSAPGEESQPEWEDFMNAEDYLNDEDKFNITKRLVLLFPKIDVDPVDGFVSEHEVTEWNLHQAEKDVLHRTQREMEIHDKNHDGFISFSEYEPPSWVNNAGSFANSDYYLFIWHKQSAYLVPLSNLLPDSLVGFAANILLMLMFIVFLCNMVIVGAVLIMVL